MKGRVMKLKIGIVCFLVCGIVSTALPSPRAPREQVTAVSAEKIVAVFNEQGYESLYLPMDMVNMLGGSPLLYKNLQHYVGVLCGEVMKRKFGKVEDGAVDAEGIERQQLVTKLKITIVPLLILPGK